MRYIVALLSAFFLYNGISFAADETLGLVAGSKTGTYIAVGRDIARVAKDAGVSVTVKDSDGSIDNIKRINSRENAGLGIVQSDVLSFLKRSENKETLKVASHLRLVLPLYTEEVHILARKNIHSLSDLAGKKVVVGEEGSGHMLTAVNLLSLMDIKVEDTVRVNPPEGVVMVLEGSADAIIFVGGKPVRLFKNMEDLESPGHEKFKGLLENVHFIPINEPRVLEEYEPAEITHADYDFVHETVPTIAVNAVLVSFNFSDRDSKSAQKRCEQIGTIAHALRRELKALKESGHPKWKEVDFSANVANWKKDPCAWGGVKSKPPEKKRKQK